MGRKSTKENKNIYQISRENNGLTRDAAAERLEFISSDRIEKIESEKSNPHPDEILAMAECYKNPSLCNYYCSHECPIGREYVPEVTSKDLSLITLEMLSTLNTLSKEKDRMIDIAADGMVSKDEPNPDASGENAESIKEQVVEEVKAKKAPKKSTKKEE